MATIHISRAEAASDFDALIARVSNGDEIVIEDGYNSVAVLRAPEKPHLRPLSESLRLARERSSNATLDGEFEKDLNAIIESHIEPLIDPKNDPWA